MLSQAARNRIKSIDNAHLPRNFFLSSLATKEQKFWLMLLSAKIYCSGEMKFLGKRKFLIAVWKLGENSKNN